MKTIGRSTSPGARRMAVGLGALVTTLICLGGTSADAQTRYRGGPSWSSSPHATNALRVRIGLFEPDGESGFWDTQFQDFTGEISDLEDLVLGVDYLWPLGRSTSLAFGVSFWEGETSQSYRDFTDQLGSPIRHSTTLEATDLTVALQYRLGSPNARIAPYLGVGAGFVWWRLEEIGDFIDFSDPGLPVVYAFYEAEGTTTEIFGLAGLDMELSPTWSFIVEGRWRRADDELGDDYEGFGEIDLGGTELTAGFAFRF